MANEQAAKAIFKAPIPSADAAMDAMLFLLHSPELPMPTIHSDTFDGKPNAILQWLDPKNLYWVRAWFAGDEGFDWMCAGPPLDDDTGGSGIHNVRYGAPGAMVNYINFVTREAA